MRAIILAGGFGTRLQTVVSDLPKPMAPIGNKPFLAYLLEYLSRQGITEVILSLHYLPERISDYFFSEYVGIKISYVIEEQPLGTGGAICYALQQAQWLVQEPVFILNGDTFVTLDYKAMYKNHREKTSKLSIALCEISDCSRYGRATINNSEIVGFQEKGFAGQGYINAGVYLLSQELFAGYSLPKCFSFEHDFLFKECQQLKPQAFFTQNYFIDIGIPEDYAKACYDLPQII